MDQTKTRIRVPCSTLHWLDCVLMRPFYSVFVSLQNAGGDPAVSSTVNPSLTTKRSKVKTEAEALLPISPSAQVGGRAAHKPTNQQPA